MIFNFVIEPLIKRLQNESRRTDVARLNLAAMAFAEDITWLAYKARAQLERVRDYLKTLDMNLSINKCAAFKYVPTAKTWYAREPRIELDGINVPYSLS